MAASSSGSSFASSSLSHPTSRSRSYLSPVDSTWTHTSGISTISDPSTGSSLVPPTFSSQSLDLGPPGYTATITLFPDTPDERTVYLGPWEIVDSEPRCIVWQCSYQKEVLEHYLSSDHPSEVHPHTLHSRHRQFHDPSDMERYLTFIEPQRIRYTTNDGICIHDDFITARYEFTAVASSVQFQGDLRQKQLVSFYDMDVVWTDKDSRTDRFGNVKGIGAIQRLKLWRDSYTLLHSLTILANKTDKQYHEYHVHNFDNELKKEEGQRRIRLTLDTRRGSASSNPTSPRVSFAQRLRRSTGQSSRTRPELDSSPQAITMNIRRLNLQFTSDKGYQQFRADWVRARGADDALRMTAFSPDLDLPSSRAVPVAPIRPGAVAEQG